MPPGFYRPVPPHLHLHVEWDVDVRWKWCYVFVAVNMMILRSKPGPDLTGSEVAIGRNRLYVALVHPSPVIRRPSVLFVFQDQINHGPKNSFELHLGLRQRRQRHHGLALQGARPWRRCWRGPPKSPTPRQTIFP